MKVGSPTGILFRRSSSEEGIYSHSRIDEIRLGFAREKGKGKGLKDLNFVL